MQFLSYSRISNTNLIAMGETVLDSGGEKKLEQIMMDNKAKHCSKEPNTDRQRRQRRGLRAALKWALGLGYTHTQLSPEHLLVGLAGIPVVGDNPGSEIFITLVQPSS